MRAKRFIISALLALVPWTYCIASSAKGEEVFRIQSRKDTLSVQIFYHRGHYDIDSKYRNNRQNLASFFAALDSLDNTPGIRIDSTVHIFSSASPEGKSTRNAVLSRNRAATLEVLFKINGIPGLNFSINSIGEYWEGLSRLLRESDISGREKALDIIDNTPTYIYKKGKIVGGRKKAAMDLKGGRVWREMDRRLFPELRQATLSVCYTSMEMLPSPAAISSSARSGFKAQPTPPNTEILPHKQQKELFAIKSNLLYDAASLLNVGIEVPVGERFSIAADAVFPWWQNREKDITIQMLAASLEGRYWFGDRSLYRPLTGFFAGLYAGAGYFDFQLGKLSGGNGVQGDFFMMGGLSAGYAHSIGDNLRFEYSIGLGYIRSDYQEYISVKDTKFGNIKVIPYPWDVKRISGIVPSRISVSLVWTIPSGKGGGR